MANNLPRGLRKVVREALESESDAQVYQALERVVAYFKEREGGLKVRLRTYEFDDSQRVQIARYFDAVNGDPWGEGWEDDPSVMRLATHQECWQYAENLLGGYLDDAELRASADQQEGAI